MWGLLSWLWERAGRVYTFFGWLYDRLVDAALNAYNWAVAKANDAYWAAIDQLKIYFDWLFARINEARDWAWNWITFTWRTITTQVGNALSTAWTWTQETWIRARDWTIAKWLDGIAHAVDLFNKAVEGAQNLVNGVVALADALFAKSLEVSIELFQQVNADLEGVRTTLGLGDPVTQRLIVSWINNPIGTLAGYLKLFFQSMLEYSVAYAMGTIKYPLPPWPDFSFGTGDVPIPSPDLPPTDISGLVAPLTSIRVSGYTFGPGHSGIDLGLTLGQIVYAMHDGKVKAAGWDPSGYGNKIDLGNGEWWTRYAHLETMLVRPGDSVSAGDAIGGGNSTGNSTGNHLHLEIKRYGSYIDPLTVL